MTLPKILALYGQQTMVLWHQKAALYHPFIDALALTLVDVPISIVDVLVLSVILYFMAGLQRTPADYNTFYLPSFPLTDLLK